MKLFDIGEDKQVLLNKAWIMLIPEFGTLFKRDKGKAGTGDYRGDKKLRATSEFTFIYFYTDFSSPIRDWEDDERKKEALYYASLDEKDLDDKLWKAQEKYHELQLKSSRPLRTLKALYKGMDAMDEYFEAIDFTLRDSLKRLVHDPSAFVTNAGKLNKMYDEIRNFERRVEDDLRQAASGIRGPNSTLGDQEGQSKTWNEEDISQGSRHTNNQINSSSSFAEIVKITQELAKKEREEDKQPDKVFMEEMKE